MWFRLASAALPGLPLPEGATIRGQPSRPPLIRRLPDKRRDDRRVSPKIMIDAARKVRIIRAFLEALGA